MFGNMDRITTTTKSKNAESVERLNLCSPADWWGFLFWGEYGYNRSEEEFKCFVQ